MRVFWYGVLLCGIAVAAARAQDTGAYSRKNTWTAFAEYSGSSSHVLMGESRQRKLTDLGFGYSRSVVRFWGSDLSYHAELRPVLFESDPLTIDHFTETAVLHTGPVSVSGVSSSVSAQKCVPYNYTETFTAVGGTAPDLMIVNNNTCGRQWTFGRRFLRWASSGRRARTMRCSRSLRAHWDTCTRAVLFRWPMPRHSTSSSTLARESRSFAWQALRGRGVHVLALLQPRYSGGQPWHGQHDAEGLVQLWAVSHPRPLHRVDGDAVCGWI